jgi:hypothetical protein
MSAGAASFAVIDVVTLAPFRVAVTVAVWSLETFMVVMLNDTLFLPAATLTAFGTLTALLLLVIGMTKPPAGAGSVIVSFAVDVNPPVPLLGVASNVDGTIGRIVSVPDAETPLAVAVIVTSFCAVTACVVTLKLASVAPAETVTVAGTVAPAPPAWRETTTPPVGAAAASLTLPADAVPPRTVDGESVTCTGTARGDKIRRVAVFVTPDSDAERVTSVSVVTVDATTFATALLCPAAIVTDAGTVTFAFPDVSATTKPPAGAGPLIVTVS